MRREIKEIESHYKNQSERRVILHSILQCDICVICQECICPLLINEKRELGPLGIIKKGNELCALVSFNIKEQANNNAGHSHTIMTESGMRFLEMGRLLRTPITGLKINLLAASDNTVATATVNKYLNVTDR
jgi:hypothetical protein